METSWFEITEIKKGTQSDDVIRCGGGFMCYHAYVRDVTGVTGAVPPDEQTDLVFHHRRGPDAVSCRPSQVSD